MAIAAEALLRLKAVLDDEGFRKAEGALRGLDNQAKRTGGTIGGRVNRPLDRMERGLDRVNNSRPMQAVNRGLVATGAGLGLAVKAAVDFENEFSGVRKQLGLDIKSPILDTYRRQLLDLSTKTPTPVAALARIATEGAKVGLRGSPLLEYVNQVQKASKAMEIPAEELVGNFNGINAALQQSPRQGYKMLDFINRLDDDLAGQVSSRQILEGMSRIGSFPKLAGVRSQDTAAMLSTIIAQNKTPEQAATGLKNFLLPIAGGSQALTKEKRNTLAQLYGFSDPQVKFLQQQKKSIEGEITSIEGTLTKGGLLKPQKLWLNQELKRLKFELKGVDKQIKERPGSEAYGTSIANDLAKRMQIDSRGTILEVIKKIKELPRDKQLGFVTEFFGKDSASEIMALVENTNLLSSAFSLVDQEMGKTKGQIGSVQKEYDTLLQGAPAQLEMFKNSLMAPAIEIGRTLLPALLEVTRALKPMIDGFTDFVRKNPEAVTNFVKIAGAVAGLKIAMMGLGVVVSVLQGVGTAIRGLGTAATFLVNLPRTIAGTLGAVGPLLQKLKGLGTGGGMFAGIISAAKGLAGRVMGPIRSLVGMIRIAFAGLTFRELFPGLANRLQQLKGTVARIFGKGAAQGAIGGAANNIRPTVLRPMNNIRPFTRMPPVANPMPWLGSIGTALTRLGPLLLGFGSTVARVFMGPVGWVTLLIGAGVALYAFRDKIGQFVEWVKPKLAGALGPLVGLNQQKAAPGGKQPAQQGFNPIAALNPAALGANLGNAIAGGIASIGEKLAPLFARISTLFTTYVVNPIKAVWNFLVVYIGQTIAAYAITWWQGISTNFQTNVVIPIQTMWTNFVTWIGTTVAGIQGRLSGIWVGISTLFNQHVSAPISQFWNWLVGTITQGAANLRNTLAGWWSGISARFQAEVVTPIQQLWSNFTGWLTERTAGVRNGIGGMWNGLAQGFQQHIVTPVQNLWNSLVQGMQSKWTDTVNFFQNAWNYVATGISVRVVAPIRNLFTGLADNIRSVFDNLLGWARNLGNSIIDRVNPVRQAAGFQPLQRFAKGGYVNGPTLGLIGEGRDPREYIIPERSMLGASVNYLNGKRGASVLSGVPRFAGGGYIKGGGSGFISYRDPVYLKQRGLTAKDAEVGSITINGRKIYKDDKDYAKKLRDAFASAGISNVIMGKSSGPSYGTQNLARIRQQRQSGFAGDAMSKEEKISRLRSNLAHKLMDARRDRSGIRMTMLAKEMQALDLEIWRLTGGRRSFGMGGSARNSLDYGRKITNSVSRSTRKMDTDVESAKQMAAAAMDQARQRVQSEVMQRTSELMSRYGLSMPEIPGYARGGYVNKPTLGLIGEAGDNEYIIPERRMAASAMAFLLGARGMDVINPPRFANGGVVGSSVSNRSGNINALLERTGAIGGQTVVVQEPTINATIQVSTGDVLQFEGQQYVTLADYQRGLKQVQSETLGLLRTAQGRRATGR